MDDVAVGRAIRALRVRASRRQVDVAASARVSQSTVSRIELGQLGAVTIDSLRRVGDVLGLRVDLATRWRGGELDRLLGARHSAMHEAIARRLADLQDWTAVPEVTFSLWGERGAIDVLAWHAGSRTLLVVELKTELVDVQELLGTLDRKRRLAPEAVRERDWAPDVVAVWLLLAESPTNRRRVAQHREVLRAVLPAGGREMDRWLAAPAGRIAALTFLSSTHGAHGPYAFAPVRRVRKARAPGQRAASSPQRAA